MQGRRVLARDLLRAQMLLDGHRKVGAAFDRRIVGDDHHFAAVDDADAGDDPGARGRAFVQIRRRRAARAQETPCPDPEVCDPVADKELAALLVLGARFLAAALPDLTQSRLRARQRACDDVRRWL